MYCKHCGKEIADDSKFCQHCGEKQDVSLTIDDKGVDKNMANSIHSSIVRMTILVYVVWAVLHIVCWIFGKPRTIYEFGTFEPKDYFYPFTRSPFDIEYYDGSEFFVYVLLVPLFLYFLYFFFNNFIIKRQH